MRHIVRKMTTDVKKSAVMENEKDEMKSRMAYAGRWCAAICALSTVGLTMTIPFSSAQRDKHGCDAMCVGSMTSARSALGLIGGVVVGRLSDSHGRKCALVLGLVAGIVGTVIFGAMDSLAGLWLSMIPSALLSHQFLVLKVRYPMIYF
jgi:MFS family permease